MRSDDPAEKDAHASSPHRREQISSAIGHLQAALTVLDHQGEAPHLGARVEECIISLSELLERES